MAGPAIGAAALQAGGNLLTGILGSIAARERQKREMRMKAAQNLGQQRAQAAQNMAQGQSGALGQLMQGFRGALL